MLDIKFLRENPDLVKENIKKKFQDSKLPLVDEVIALDEEMRKNKKKADGSHPKNKLLFTKTDTYLNLVMKLNFS